MEDPSQIIKAKVASAPPEVKKVLIDRSWNSAVEEVATKNGLSPEQRNALENEIIFVLLGLELARSFRANVEKSVGVPQNIAMSMADKISARVFAPLKSVLPSWEKGEPEAEEEKLLETPEIVEHRKPLDIPAAPAAKPAAPVIPGEISPVAEKLNKFSAPAKPNAYPEGKDPYREPIN